jgi:hypothetical protein
MIVIFLDDKVSVMQQIAKALSRTKELYLPPKEPYDLPKEPYDHAMAGMVVYTHTHTCIHVYIRVYMYISIHIFTGECVGVQVCRCV